MDREYGGIPAQAVPEAGDIAGLSDAACSELIGLLQQEASRLRHLPENAGAGSTGAFYRQACHNLAGVLTPPMDGDELYRQLMGWRSAKMIAGKRAKAAGGNGRVRAENPLKGPGRKKEIGGLVVRAEGHLPALFAAKVEEIHEPLEAQKARLEAGVVEVLRGLKANERVTLSTAEAGGEAGKILCEYLWSELPRLLKKVAWYKPRRDGTRLGLTKIDRVTVQIARYS